MSKHPPISQQTRVLKLLHALNILREKEIVTFTMRQAVGEIDQRVNTSLGDPRRYEKVWKALERYGVVQCLNPEKRRNRQFKVINWKAVQVLLNQLSGDQHDIDTAMSTIQMNCTYPITGDTDEHEVPEPIEEEERKTIRSDGSTAPRTGSILRAHTNGRKKVGWFKRTFTNAEVVEELRETNSRLQKLLEVWND